MAFEKARSEGKQYVITSSCRTGPNGGASHILETAGLVATIHLAEFSVAASKESLDQDLREIFDRRGRSLFIRRVCDIASGIKGGPELLPDDINQLQKRFAWDDRNWCFKLFSKRPPNGITLG